MLRGTILSATVLLEINSRGKGFPTLIVWGKNDFIFLADGASPYQRDLKNVETHILDTGHFALETHAEEIATRIQEFLLKNLKR